MPDSASTLVNEVDRLGSMPEVAARLDRMLEDENSSAWDIGRVIEQDPGLSAALLRLANSALYNVGGVPVTAADRAVTMVGAGRVRDLAYSVFAVSAFSGIPDDLVNMQSFWEHSLRSATAASAIASHAGLPHGDALFVAGLLHDIGKLVMYGLRPDASHKVLERVRQAPGDSEVDLEREAFGFDHAAVGAALADRWALPRALGAAIAHHHDCGGLATAEFAPRVVCLASGLSRLPHEDSGATDEGPAPPVDDALLEGIGLAREALDEVRRDADAMFRELRSIFIKDDAA